MKKLIIAILIAVTVMATPSFSLAEDQMQDKERDLLLALLEPHLSEAVEKYYGRPRQYDLFEADLLELNRDPECQYCFEVKVKVTTFTGPHDPPYASETITLDVRKGKVVIVDYYHEKEKS